METGWSGDIDWVPGESAVVFNPVSPMAPSGTWDATYCNRICANEFSMTRYIVQALNVNIESLDSIGRCIRCV